MLTLRLKDYERPTAENPTYTSISRQISSRIKKFAKENGLILPTLEQEGQVEHIELTAPIQIEVYGIKRGESQKAYITNIEEYRILYPYNNSYLNLLRLELRIEPEIEKHQYGGKLGDDEIIKLTPNQENIIFSEKGHFIALPANTLENLQEKLAKVPRVSKDITYENYRKIKGESVGFLFFAPQRMVIVRLKIISIVTENGNDQREIEGIPCYVVGFDSQQIKVFAIKQGAYIKTLKHLI